MLYESTILLAVFLAFVSRVVADCQTINGTPFCQKTNKITYKGIGFAGSYNKVTDMNEETGACLLSPFSFSGSMSPLDEDLSVHFRGPVVLKQFGVYYPASLNHKRDEGGCTTTKNAHHHHKRAQTVYQHVTQTVMLDANGNPVPPASALAGGAPAQSPSVKPSSAPALGLSAPGLSSVIGGESSAASSLAGSSGLSGTGWTRTAYFTPNNAQGLVFMNHMGAWLSQFGNGVGYCNADATQSSPEPVALGGGLIKSNTEFMIFSDQACDASCGTCRKGIPAKKGFGGNTKIFVFEFSMPSDAGAGGLNADKPSIWLLNAQIPRTLQYGKAECSCWKTGCGELDLFEVISSGQTMMLSHLHDKQAGNGGGLSDWFQRPLTNSVKMAVVFKDLNIHILEVNQDFGSSLDEATVDAWIAQAGTMATIGY